MSDEFTCNGKTVSFSKSESNVELTVDGIRVPTMFDDEAGCYSSPDIPYQSFETIQELALAVVGR